MTAVGKFPRKASKRMQLDGRFASSELGPREQGQTEVDGRRVQCVGHLFQFDPEILVAVQSGGTFDQHVSEIGEDAPIPPLVGIGQGTAGRLGANAAVIDLRAQRLQAGLDVAQTLPEGQLCKRQNQKLVVARQPANAAVPAVAPHACVELVFGQPIHQLGKDRPASMHAWLLPPVTWEKPCRKAG